MAGRYPRVLPSKAFTEYEKLALQQLQFYRKRFYVAGPVHVRCRYYMPDKRSWPDLVGLLQATSDILTMRNLLTTINGSYTTMAHALPELIRVRRELK